MSAVLDYDHLEQYVSGDAALRDEILTIFTDQAAHWGDALKPGLDDEGWRHAAHALKGAARGVGAWTLGDLCEQAESLTGDADDKAASRRELLVELKSAIENAVEEARRQRERA